ncbi:phenylalanine--tRNA ligase alpha subunit [Candidatus Methanoplasma termitum]|uniref:Phenylalanine--tRNA ligase alpha subunit n=1 Tax=Candidatus Methanoplasma termitum TaxID=1577791 RepID=A0A0A7LH09_9ARCH|nr:phenylalanine--tRNA ligase subunit alpha [Candidatus Methanoplasma termitum]AIZ56801.1 phenylalanine--tRNA ligase alpha subunit [Candidatus Methanoplasma termitum]
MVSDIVEGLSYNETKLLIALGEINGAASPAELIKIGKFNLEVDVMGAAKRLEFKGLVKIEERTEKYFELTDKGILERGLPERRALSIINESGGEIGMGGLADKMPNGEDKIAIGWLKRKGLVNISYDGIFNIVSLTANGLTALLGSKMSDEVLLEQMASSPISEKDADPKIIKDLKGRQGLIKDKIVTQRTMELTEDGKRVISQGLVLKEEVTDITDRLVQSGEWKNVNFRKYDVGAFAPTVTPAKKHPLTRLGDEIRQLFASRGFVEMSSDYVQPAFWNLDVLFTPQDHPARDLQDTFYLDIPDKIDLEDEALVQKVRDIHENGGDTGSTGWGGEWSREKAEAALLRTHSTVSSIRYVAEHPDAPQKAFSISRIFRNESIDSTHLPEFTQIEGIVIDENGNFDMLVSMIREFYANMGFDQIRIRPAYFPYTEPSLELEVFFNGKWMELGGAGVFRPEVVEPFGVKYPVLAWGFGFERLAMLKWNITDIRDLYISDMDDLKKNTVF